MFDSIPATVFRDGTPQALTDEQEKLKREIYEKMNPRRRKFVDRIGYENWDPFQKPNDPLDLRMDVSKRTTQQLVNEFLREAARKGPYSNDYGKDKGTEQEDGNPMDFLWNTYGKCHTDDR